ncbi:conserved Plasmodium protein, unknown function [Plasmodium ovale]|uniref:C2H2-type domain-containing protein n=1 Tax=Plasmodium ovale TaxID=36330 RepID=A0A1D3KWU5_PLAOA|nr:conserved Plasmodium protein, unknown function [Plasmodium ovale]
MDRVLIKYIFDELCTSFNKKEINGYKKRKVDNNNNDISYCITLQDLFENLERNKNMHMDIYMKKEILENVFYCKDICILKQEKKNKQLDEYNNDVDIKIDGESQNVIISSASLYNVYINNIYIYNKHNLFYYERIKECKEKILILLYIVSGRYNGSIQSSLSKHLNVDVKMIHYHLKVLFQYFLIKKISINISNIEKNIDNNNNHNHNNHNNNNHNNNNHNNNNHNNNHNHNNHNHNHNKNTIKLNPSYILYFNVYFIYNLLPIFIKNILYSQNVLSINKIIMYLLNKFIIIPQKILSLIFFKLLIVYNPYYFTQIRKALKIFNAILSNLIKNKKIIMCKIKIHSSYENCYLNYENKDKINYDNIINFLLLFYYNYDYLIKFINKSCYLMCEDYVKKIQFKSEFGMENTTTKCAWNQLGMYLKGKNHSNLSSSPVWKTTSDTPSLHLLEKEYREKNLQSLPSSDFHINQTDSHSRDMHHSDFVTSDSRSPNWRTKGEDDNIHVNEKNCNLLMNEFRNYMDLSMDNKLNDTDYYSSSQNENQDSSLSEFSFLGENNKIVDNINPDNENQKNKVRERNERNESSHSASSFASQTDTDSDSSVESTNVGIGNGWGNTKGRNVHANSLSLYNEIKYMIMSKGVRGMTTKEISQMLLLSIKKTNTFLNKLVRNKDVVKIPERKDKSFMYRFIDNYIYQYLQKNPRVPPSKGNYSDNEKNFNLAKVSGSEEKKTLQNTPKKSDVIVINENDYAKNEHNSNNWELLQSGSQTPPIEVGRKPNTESTKQFIHVQFKNLNESLNVLNYIDTVDKIDVNVLMYVVPKYTDSVSNFPSFKMFFDNYVEKFKCFEEKYDLYTCSFHFFYYLKYIQTKCISDYSTKLVNCEVEGENTNDLRTCDTSEHFEKEFYIKNIDSSKNNIDFIKYFMEDTTKLKSNLFIKRLFIFSHFLICSKVTTFRFIQDLFVTIENSGRTIDRKSVQRLFNYSTKINSFFKRYTLRNNKTIKYYFYDSHAVSEKQSSELHAKYQLEYAQHFYKHNTTDRTNKEKTQYCYNLSGANRTRNKLKYAINLCSDETGERVHCVEVPTSAHIGINRTDQIDQKRGVLQKKSDSICDIIKMENIETNECGNITIAATETEKELPNGEEDINLCQTVYCIEDTMGKGTSHHSIPNGRINRIGSNYQTNAFVMSPNLHQLNSKRKNYNINFPILTKKSKVEYFQKVNEQIHDHTVTATHSQDDLSNRLKETGEEWNSETEKDQISIITPQLEDKKGPQDGKHEREIAPQSRNGDKCNVLYIDILNESAFTCKENKLISKRLKSSNVFQNFKTTQEFTYSINYFNGFIFSKMARYKYFHKCLIRILKKKKYKEEKKKKRNITNEIDQNGEIQIALCQNRSKKRKLSHMEIKQFGQVGQKKKQSYNVLKVRDILRNLYLDEYLKIISVGCKLNYIENYLLNEKKKKKLKDLPPLLFEFLTSYSLLNSNKKNLVENFLLRRNEDMYLHELTRYEQMRCITVPTSKCKKLEGNIGSVADPSNEGQEELFRNNLTQRGKNKSEDLCQHDINIIKNNDRICIFFFLYRKLKFLHNMNLVRLTFKSINRKKKFPYNVRSSTNSGKTKNRELNMSFVDLKKSNLQIYIKKIVTINLFTPKKRKKKQRTYNMMRYNNFEEFYYNLYLSVERFKKFLPDACMKDPAKGKLKLQDVLKNSDVKNKSLKFLLLHNSYTNHLFLTRKIRKLFLHLIKKVKKRNVEKSSKLMERLPSYKEYNIFRNVYNISKITIEKYFTIFFDMYDKEKSSSSMITTEKDLSFSCPFCNELFFFKNDLLSHISNFHNINKSFSDLISFFSNSKHMIHKKLSDFLKIKKKIADVQNPFLEYTLNEKGTNMHKSDVVNSQNLVDNKIRLHQNDSWRERNDMQLLLNSINEKEYQTPQSPQLTHVRSNDSLAKMNNSQNVETFHLKEKANKPHNVFSLNTNNDKGMKNMLENVKVKYSLKIVYVYFVTIILQLMMSQKNFKNEKNRSIRKTQTKMRSKYCDICDAHKRNFTQREKSKSPITTDDVATKTKNKIAHKSICNCEIDKKKKEKNILKKKVLLRKDITQRSSNRKEKSYSFRKKKKKKLKRGTFDLLSSFGKNPSKNNFIMTKLNKFRVIYYLKNKTNSIPYKKSLWIRANAMMVGKFEENICMYIQKKLFSYFKKNIIHYFFILSNENLTRCILNYFATYIYNCTYTNINYYYDKYIKNIYEFKFISLVNLLKLFIINYGEQFSVYKEIIKPLFFQKIEDIKNALRYLKRRTYVVDTSYVLSNYICNDLICDNIYANLVYKSIFYKKRLSLFSKKSLFDNVIDIVYLFGSYHALKTLEGEHTESVHRISNRLNCNVGDLLHYIDSVYNEEHFQDIPNEDDYSNHAILHRNRIHLSKDTITENFYKNVNFGEELNSDRIFQCGDDNMHEMRRSRSGGYSTGSGDMDENYHSSEGSNEECKKYYFGKNLTIFDVNYYLSNFLKGNMILYACNNYIIRDGDDSGGDRDYAGGGSYGEDIDHGICGDYDSDNRGNRDNQSNHGARRKQTGSIITNNFKNKEYENSYGEEDISVSNMSSGNDSDIFDNLSDDYEIIKLLENNNDNSKKVLGGINKHIKCLTKHVSEYFPNYYILNSFEKKKLSKKISNIFSDSKQGYISHITSGTCMSNILQQFYYDQSYINNSLFDYFKRYCLHIYEQDITADVPSKPFKNAFLLKRGNANNFNYTILFNKYIQANNFANALTYKKNKLLIFNMNKKTFIDFDVYPQNIHLYNIAYLSNVHKNVDTLLDIQISNLKNSIFWLERVKRRDKKSPEQLMREQNSPEQLMREQNSPEQLMREQNSPEQLMRDQNSPEQLMRDQNSPEQELLKETSHGQTAGKETPLEQTSTKRKATNSREHKVNNVQEGDMTKISEKTSEIKKIERSKSNAELTKFVKRAKIIKHRTKNNNTFKEAFIFVTNILYHVFYCQDILNSYDECGNFKDELMENSVKKTNISENVFRIGNCTERKTNHIDANHYNLCDHNAREENDYTNEHDEEENCSGGRYSVEEYSEPNRLKKTNLVNQRNGYSRKSQSTDGKKKLFNGKNDGTFYTKRKNYPLFNKIVNRMLFVFLSIKKKKEEGRFIDSLKKMYLQQFMKSTHHGEYRNVKKEYDFIIFLLSKLNLIKIFPFMNTHKIFLAQYHNDNNVCKRRNLFYEHNYKYPFLNMINCHLRNSKLHLKKCTDNDTEGFKRFVEKSEMVSRTDVELGDTKVSKGTNANGRNSPDKEICVNESNVINHKSNARYSMRNDDDDSAGENYTSEKHLYKKTVQEKVVHNGNNLDYSDYIYINFVNNNTLRKPNFIPRLILLFNLQCYIIIHDYFFMYLLQNYEEMKKLKRDEVRYNMEDYTIFRTKIGNKLLRRIENKKYINVIKYVKTIINKACKYFENSLYLYKKKNESSCKKKFTIYYFNDRYFTASSFIYVNGGTNIKFIFFYIIKIFFYLKSNPYSSIFDIYKSVEILNFCDLNFLLRAMSQDGFVSFKLMYVSRRSEMYKLKKNYKIINDFNSLIAYENVQRGKNRANKRAYEQTKRRREETKNTDFLFDTTTSSSDEGFTTDDFLQKIKTNKKNRKNRNVQMENVHIVRDTKLHLKKKRKGSFAYYNSFMEKMLYRKVKLYYVEDENVIFKKFTGTLWN